MEEISSKNKLPQDTIFYALYYMKYDREITDNDFLCVIREKFFCSNKKLRSKKMIYRGSSVYQYSYNMSSKAPLKWKKIKDGVLLEDVVCIRNKYAVVSYDEDDVSKLRKKQLFSNSHALISNEYISADNNYSEKVEIKNSNKVVLHSYDGDKQTETILFPCAVISDPIMRKKFTDMFGVPEVIAKTNLGDFYFCNYDLMMKITALNKGELSLFEQNGKHSKTDENLRLKLSVTETEDSFKAVLKNSTLKIKSANKEYYYFGTVKNSKREGLGYTVMPNGKIAYNGQYKDNQRNGFGAYYYENGKLCYVGNWKSNRKNNMGIQFSANSDGFTVCNWENNEPIGRFTSFDINGDPIHFGKITSDKKKTNRITYIKNSDCIFINKACTDDGVLFDANGNMLYQGRFVNGKKEGKGTLYNTSGKIEYIGQFENDKFSGLGALKLSNGHIIKTSFKDGEIINTVSEFDENGAKVYSGYWKNGKRNGEGCFFLKDGGRCEGIFKAGEPTGIIKEYDKNDKLTYEGEYRDYRYSGHGIYYLNGEKFYEGEFKEGKLHGKGRLYRNGKIIFVGSFLNGMKNGFGTAYVNGNTIYSGEWKDNLYDGIGAICKNNEILFCGEFSRGKKDGRINLIKNGIVCEEQVYKNDTLTYTKKIDVSNPKEAHLMYMGNIKNNLPNGMGCIFDKYCGKQQEGLFEDGKLIRNMKIRFDELKELPKSEYLKNTAYDFLRKSVNIVVEKDMPDGYIYSGMLDENNRPTGIATALYSDHIYIGNFDAGIACGNGIIYTNDGFTIRGYFTKEKTADSVEYSFLDNMIYFCTEEK